MNTQTLTFDQIPSFLLTLSKDISFIKDNLTVASSHHGVEQPIDVQDATDFMNLENVQTTYRMVREGRIPFHKKGSRLYFYKSELNQWIKGQLQIK